MIDPGRANTASRSPAHDPDIPELFTLSEAAKLLRRPYSTLTREFRLGLIRGYRRPYRIDKAELLRLLEESRV